MSDKRKLEEFHDPDYPQNTHLKRKCLVNLSSEERLEKIRSVIRREFQRELTMKEQEVMDIENRILFAKKLLQRVRYAVVASYYNKKLLELSETEIRQSMNKPLPQDMTKGLQTAIHPALKNILGKRTADYDEILKIRPTREAAKTAKTCISEKLRSKTEEKRLQRAQNGVTEPTVNLENLGKIPRHVEPVKVDKQIRQLNIPRGRNQSKHLIAVGNTSKYIGDEKSSDKVTHKWLVYVQTKSGAPIEKIVNKVRFFLHPSYRPNDIVDVCSPPFQLSRRGWGEFPIRIQLFFDLRLQQKPVQLVHNLVLDKTMSGLQTMGAETLVELWLCLNSLQNETAIKSKEPTENVNHNNESDKNITADNNKVSIKSSGKSLLNDSNRNLYELLNQIQTQSVSLCPEDEKIEPTLTDTSIIENTTRGFDKITTAVKSLQCNDQVKSVVGNIEKRNAMENNIGISNLPSALTKDQMKLNEPLENNKEAQKEKNTNVPVLNIQPSVTNSNQQKIFQKKYVKCISKDGNVRLMEMLVSLNGNGEKGVIQSNSKKIFLTNLSKNATNNIKCNPATTSASLKAVSTTSNSLVLTNSISKNVIAANSDNGNFINQMNLGKKVIFVNTKPISNIQTNQTIPKISEQSTQSPPTKNLDNHPSNHIKNVQIMKQNNLQITNNTVQQSKLIDETLLQNQKLNVQPSQKKCLPQQLANISQIKPIQNNGPIRLKTPNKNHILFKNGKMYIIDPVQTKLKQESKKQESLLKPQISLLKPIVKNDNFSNLLRNETNKIQNHTSIATDHDYTLLIGESSTTNIINVQKPISNLIQTTYINNNRINIITPKSENNCKNIYIKSGQTPKPIALMQKPRINYRKLLEEKFYSLKVYSIRYAVEFLLKQLPLINKLAINSDFKSSFPFIVHNDKIFNELITPKQKSNEWLRAKYIIEILQKHENIDTTKLWSTKEIILFGRQHAYTPVIKYYKKVPELGDTKSDKKNLKDLVKKEIKREKYHRITVTLVNDAYNWINKVREKLDGEIQLNEDIINVDEIDDSQEQLARNKINHTESPVKDMKNKYWLPIENKLEIESSLVNDMCHDIGIRLKPEEILPNVMHSTAQILLAQSLRSFLDDLLRRSISSKSETEYSGPLLETAVQPNDVKNAILSRTQFDFLTNKDLGVFGVTTKIKPKFD